jgi:NADH:ubiquinone oxidoreductase subunit F (NADH-binding)
MTTFTPMARALPARRLGLAGHQQAHGVLPLAAFDGREGRRRLIAEVTAAGLRGRGGGGFPTARKLAAVRGRRPIVVANGCEGDPLSSKDRTLLGLAPHLVLDGIQLAAHAVAATEAVLCLHEGSRARASVEGALAERRTDPVPVRIVEVPPRYVASEESALVHYLTTGDARPTGKEPRPAERGVDRRPTLVDNVDTLAQLALIARQGAGTYRRTRMDLVTINGAVRQSGVLEVPPETTAAELIGYAGGPARPVQAVLMGGYGGTWLPWTAATAAGPAVGAVPGIASMHVLPASACGLAFTAKVLTHLADESARQCGPCMFGLPAIAADLTGLVAGDRHALGRLERRLPLVTGRGACAHPDGAVRLAASALRVFGQDVTAHLRERRCTARYGGSR